MHTVSGTYRWITHLAWITCATGLHFGATAETTAELAARTRNSVATVTHFGRDGREDGQGT
jgi:hypothetical protein